MTLIFLAGAAVTAVAVWPSHPPLARTPWTKPTVGTAWDPFEAVVQSEKPVEVEAPCPDRMALLIGARCPYVAHRCLEKDGFGRCREYRNEVLCEGAFDSVWVCMDRYEYPNQPNVAPARNMTFAEAKEFCAAESKRLCRAEEWQFACEGPRLSPFAEGLKAPSDPLSDEPVLAGMTAAYGSAVHGLGGNLREWVQNVPGSPSRKPVSQAIAGGSYRSRQHECRSLVPTEGASSRAPDVGFRCCIEPDRRAPVAQKPRRNSRRGFRPIFEPAKLP